MDQLLNSPSPVVSQVLTFVLISLAIGALLFVLFPQRAGEAQLKSRMRAVAAPQRVESRGGADQGGARRRRSVEDTLRELESKQRAKAKKQNRPTLVGRMRQAGISWSRKTYFAVSAISGAVAFLVMLVSVDLGLVVSGLFGAAAGLLLPHFYVSQKRARRMRSFTAEFPNALDVIGRGLKAGLPLVDCLKTVAADGQEPVRGEFRNILHDQSFGLPLDESVERMAERVPVTEASFFAIVIAIQSRTGGSLSEAVDNLSKVLRERKKMKQKIKAMSSEAKSSAAIIGAMPVVVAGVMSLTSPDYIALLFTETAGHFVLAGSAFWMLIGCLAMRKMINFDF